MKSWRLLIVVSLLPGGSSQAAPPTLDYLFPPAWQQDSTVALTLGGKFAPWPVRVWTDCAGLTFNAETNDGKLSVLVGKEAVTGPHLLRVYNQDGASMMRTFVVTRRPDEMEKEPNDTFKQAQPIKSLPAVVTGRLEKSGDVDFFSLKVQAGKWLVARVDAYSLGSPVDAMLHLFDERGVRLAFNHDGAQGLDPLLAYEVQQAGTYLVQIAGFVHPPASEVRYAGSGATVYRLLLTDGPFAEHAFPPGVQRGISTRLKLLGWNLGDRSQTCEQSFDAPGLEENGQVFVETTGVEGRVPVALGDTPEQIESEPNDKSEEAQLVALPCGINGRLATAGDEDRFRFEARKGDRFQFLVQSASLGFPVDATLRIEDSTGRQLARDDDTGGPDPKVVWTAPADGAYVVAISDLFHKGGPDFIYRLAIGPPRPDFKVTISEAAFRLEPGRTNELKLEVTRIHGHTNALSIAVEGLPEGVVAKPVTVSTKGGEVTLPLIAAPETESTNLPIRILVQAADSSTPKSRPALFDLGGKESRGNRLINQTDRLWLTVLPRPVSSSQEKK